MSDMPVAGTDINGVPRLAGDWKLQFQEVIPDALDGDGEETTVRTTIWRTEENHMGEWLEIINRYVPPGGTFWDPTCGTGTSGLAAMRLGRKAILTDRDTSLVRAAEFRLKYYFAWMQDKYIIDRDRSLEPKPDDGLSLYRFHNCFTQNNCDPNNIVTLPSKKLRVKLPELDTAEFATHCTYHGVTVMQSTITDAGMGLFLTSSMSAGDPFAVTSPKTLLRLPYYGTYSHEPKGDRHVLVQSPSRSSNSEPVYLLGDPSCLAAFANDPSVLVCSCSLRVLFVSLFFLRSSSSR